MAAYATPGDRQNAQTGRSTDCPPRARLYPQTAKGKRQPDMTTRLVAQQHGAGLPYTPGLAGLPSKRCSALVKGASFFVDDTPIEAWGLIDESYEGADAHANAMLHKQRSQVP